MRPGLPTLIRDAAAWIGGWILMFKQAGVFFDPPPQVNETIIWAAAALIGVPGVMQIWQARYGVTTEKSGLQPQQPESSQSSPGAP